MNAPGHGVAWHDVHVTAEQAGTISNRTDATARTVIECAADAIVAFSTDQTVMLWNPAAERMFGWTAAEVTGLEPPIIPEELKAEHNAVLERVRGGGLGDEAGCGEGEKHEGEGETGFHGWAPTWAVS